jgi:hypothetical protein
MFEPPNAGLHECNLADIWEGGIPAVSVAHPGRDPGRGRRPVGHFVSPARILLSRPVDTDHGIRREPQIGMTRMGAGPDKQSSRSPPH